MRATRALNAQSSLACPLPKPLGWSPPRRPRPATGTATAPQTSDAEPSTGRPGPGNCQAGEGQRQLWTFRDSPSPPSLSSARRKRKRKRLRGWNSSPCGRPTPVGTSAEPTGEAAAPAPEAAAAVPRSWPRQPQPHSARSCPSCGRLSARGTHSFCCGSRAPSFPHLFKYRLRSGFSREKYFFKKKKEKENDTPSYIPLITTPPLGPILPPFPLPFASHRLGAGASLARRIRAVGGGSGDPVLPGLGVFV